MNALLHYRSSGKYDWKKELRDFARLPMVGELITLGEDAPWYQVQLVLHMPCEAGAQAEIFAVGVDKDETRRQAFRSTPHA